jgi:hypothetical protein
MITAPIRSKISLLALGRFQDLVLSSGDSTAATREPDSPSREQHTFFFQTLGVEPETLLASAGGVAATSKRQFMFSGFTCCVSGAKKNYIPSHSV